ncbi:MAG: hypothetical protein ACK5NG_03970 [Chthoniobacterales bacterium]
MQLNRLKCIPAVVALIFVAGTLKPSSVTVRFQLVAGSNDQDPFVTRGKTANGEPVSLQKMPVVTERDIQGFYAFPTPDGTHGAYFQLGAHGRNTVENVTSTELNSYLVALVDGRGVVKLRIDRPVRDGLLVIPSGLTNLEVMKLGQRFAIIGETPDQTRRRKRQDRIIYEEHRKTKAAQAAAEKAAAELSAAESTSRKKP